MTLRSRRYARRSALACALVLLGACVPDEPTRGRDPVAAQIHAMRVAEDARAPDPGSLQTLLDGLESTDMDARRVAVRALGRLERPDLVDAIAPLTADPEPAVRAEAANALAQAVHRASGGAVLRALLERLPREREPAVLGIVARSMARLSLTDPALRGRVQEALLSVSRDPSGAYRAPATMEGVALAMESWARRLPPGVQPEPSFVARLREMATYGRLPPIPGASRVRALAVSAMAEMNAMSLQDVHVGLDDTHTRVRRAALTGLRGLPHELWLEPIRRGLLDPSPNVRVQAVRDIGMLPRDALECMRLLAAATRDLSVLVRTVAIDQLAEPCPAESGAVDTLTLIADSGELENALDWHAPAHALVSLAALDPERARTRVPILATHVSPFARVYAARAAGRIGYAEALRTLVADPDANVRTAATEALFRLTGHDSDSLLLSQLAGDDPQLLLTTARLLKGSPSGAGVVGPLLEAFDRISTRGAQTLRDPRRELLARVGEMGGPELAPRLTRYLSDYDPVVAADVADIIDRWTGRRPAASPQATAPPPVPDRPALLRLQRTRVLLHMRRGGTITIALFPELAPTNAARFVRLAGEGYYDGLTFHRVVPDFVIQGGSPGANEYSGDGPYTRDEVGLLPHWRGTVGVSTRGRDTGDGQIFINLIDNVRLDHDYTVFGVVEDGMQAVIDVMEGDVIERAEVHVGG